MTSECTQAAAEVIPPNTTENSKQKVKRRRGKREGPPELQFLIATDPSQFKDDDVRRSVRSQAMMHWRHEHRNKRRGEGKDEARPSNEWGTASCAPESTCQPSSLPMRTERISAPQSLSVLAQPSLSHSQTKGARVESSSLDSKSGSKPSLCAGSSNWQHTSAETARYLSRCRMYTRGDAEKAVLDYEESEEHEQRQLQALIGGLATSYHIGDSHDPFEVLPQFRNPRLDALHLSRNCMRAFTSKATVMKWLPLMLSHPYIILSSNVLASTWLDMHNNCSGDSATTAMVKAETIVMIKERFAKPESQTDDATLIMVLHLFAGEMWVCNEPTLRTHERGIAALILKRGGLSTFMHNKALAEVAVACCYHYDIFCEAGVLEPFREGVLADFASVDATAALPESPLYCPKHTYLTISDDPQCSPPTLEILSDMRDLTKMFVAHMNKVHDFDAADIVHSRPPAESYEARICAIRMRLARSPSAHTPGVSVSGDWIYEACRIAAIIYATAIAMRVPFSVAADPHFISLVEPSAQFNDRVSDSRCNERHLSKTLYETLQRADTGSMWKNMSGVLYWVSAVGAAAARIPSTLNMAQQDRFAPEAYSVWVRRCLIMTATRTMIVLVFEHPTAIIAAQKTLLKVQELIGSHGT